MSLIRFLLNTGSFSVFYKHESWNLPVTFFLRHTLVEHFIIGNDFELESRSQVRQTPTKDWTEDEESNHRHLNSSWGVKCWYYCKYKRKSNFQRNQEISTFSSRFLLGLFTWMNLAQQVKTEILLLFYMNIKWVHRFFWELLEILYFCSVRSWHGRRHLENEQKVTLFLKNSTCSKTAIHSCNSI